MKRALAVLLPMGLVAAGLAAFLFGSAPATTALPAFDAVRAGWCPSDVRVLDRHGEVLHETRTDPDGRKLAWASLAETSPSLVRAVLSSEDRRFREHRGVDWTAVLAAAGQRITARSARGASTITMQLAALLDPSLARGREQRSASRKWQQMRTARALEAAWTKDEILEAYLNLVPWRGEVRGVRAAAHAIFGKAPHGLTTEESAALAASIRAPNASPSDLLVRAKRLAAEIGDRHRFPGDSSRAATSSDGKSVPVPDFRLVEVAVRRVTAVPDARGPRTDLAPHAARQLLRHAPACRDVASTIDARVQAVAAESLERRLAALRDRSARDGAVLVVENDSGDVLAYVGSSGERSPSAAVDGVRAKRQAGSSLKPFLYALAIDRRLVTAATLLEDEPLEVPLDGSLYRPANYDGKFRGLVSVRTALAASLNIPAVRALGLTGEEPFVRVLRALGFDGIDRSGSWYGPSLALGSADVTLWELAGAYRALASGGMWSPLDLRGDGRTDPRRVFDEATAFIVGDILADRGSRATTFELENPLATRFWSAAKTGTSKDMRDNWCVGWSRRYTVGVWVGNFSGEPMHDVSGTTGAAPVWNDVMTFLHDGVAGDAPATPAGVVDAATVFARDAEPSRVEHYLGGTEPGPGRAALDDWPRIAEPADGSRFAIDPDIPDERQRIPLVAHAAPAGAVWKLDGRELGRASAPLLWKPERGHHELVLADGAQTVGVVRFQVKGVTSSSSR